MTNYPFDQGELESLGDIFVPRKYRLALEQLADRKGIKVGYLVREILADYLKRTAGRIFERMEVETIRLWLRSKESGIPIERLRAIEKAKEK